MFYDSPSFHDHLLFPVNAVPVFSCGTVFFLLSFFYYCSLFWGFRIKVTIYRLSPFLSPKLSDTIYRKLGRLWAWPKRRVEAYIPCRLARAGGGAPPLACQCPLSLRQEKKKKPPRNASSKANFITPLCPSSLSPYLVSG